MTYKAPLKDMLFNIQHIADIEQVAKIPGFEDAGFETAQAVLEECAKFNEGVLAPLNWAHSSSTACAVSKPASSKPGIFATCSMSAMC